MDFTRTRSDDWLAALGGFLLLVSLFLPWYSVADFGVSGWESLSVIDVLLAIAALVALAVPFVTAARDSPAVPLVFDVGAFVLGLLTVLLVLIRLIWVPGGGSDLVDRDFGLGLAVVGALVTFFGGFRALRDDRAPGLRSTPPPERMPAPPAAG